MKCALPVAAALLVACLGTGSSSRDERWTMRIGPDADCDPSEAGCWNETDRTTLAAVSTSLDAAGSGSPEAQVAATCTVARGLAGLAHKLSGVQLERLAAREALLCAGGPIAESALVEQAAGLAADAILALELDEAQAFADAWPGLAAAGAWGGGEAYIPESWPPGVREALQRIVREHAWGRVYVEFAVRADVFGGELRNGPDAPDAGSTEEQRIERIVSETTSDARWIGLWTGALTAGGTAVMLTGAFVPLGAIATGGGVALRAWRIHVLRVRTGFRMARALGLDVLKASTVDRILALVLNAGVLPPGYETVITAGSGPGWTLLTTRVLVELAGSVVGEVGGTAALTALARILGGAIGVGVAVVQEHALHQMYCDNLLYSLRVLRR